jgi:predicted DNA-binding ribbon-helix-helix protein
MAGHNNVTQTVAYQRGVRGKRAMKSLVIKRSIVIASHKTSVALEDAFWESLKEIAKQRDESLAHLVASINADRQHANLSSAIRLYVLGFYRDQHRRRAMLVPSIRQSPDFNGFSPVP